MCTNFETASVPSPQLPPFRSAPNLAYLNQWAESQTTPMARRIAYKVIEHLQYICFEDFLQQLQKTVNDFQDQVPKDPYVILVGQTRDDNLYEGCSDLWCIGLALEHCGLRKPKAILTPNQFLQYQKKHKPILHVLMLDDASYSATQKQDIFGFLRDAPIALASIHFYVGIPYMTKMAKEILSSNESLFKALVFLEHHQMSSMTDILDAEEIFYVKKIGAGFCSSQHTVTYFDHRFADFMSNFQDVYEGGQFSSTEIVSHDELSWIDL